MQTYQIPGTNKEIVEVKGPFDKCIDALVRGKAELTSCVQLAKARIKFGAKHSVSTNGSWTGENFNYLPNTVNYLPNTDDILVAKAKYNPILQDPKEAIHCRNMGFQFYVNKKTLDQLQDLAKRNPADAIKSGVLLLKEKDLVPISTSHPESNKLGVFLYENQLKPYCDFCRKEQEIELIDVCLAGRRSIPFATLLRVHDLNGSSLLDGQNHDLRSDFRAYGLRNVPNLSSKV